MLGLLLFAWWGTRFPDRPAWRWGGRLVLGGTALALGIGGIRFFPEADRLEDSDLQVGISLTGVKLKGIDLDLGRGDYLVEIFSPACPRCTKAVSELNTFQDIPGLPPIVAVTIYEKDSQLITDFIERHRPQFEIATVSRKDFLRLAWRHGYPRLAFVRDGVVAAVWEHDEFPSRDQLLAFISADGRRWVPGKEARTDEVIYTCTDPAGRMRLVESSDDCRPDEKLGQWSKARLLVPAERRLWHSGARSTVRALNHCR